MSLMNCWELAKCGREKGGENVDDLGVCPATTFIAANGFCDGKNGGRACAFIAGTYCSGIIQGTHEDKLKDCVKCAFFRQLRTEHPDDFLAYSFFKYVKDLQPVQEDIAV